MVFLPLSPGLRVPLASFSSRTAKIVGGQTDFGKPEPFGQMPTIRYTGLASKFARRALKMAKASRLVSMYRCVFRDVFPTKL
jgi:hypothetical protein